MLAVFLSIIWCLLISLVFMSEIGIWSLPFRSFIQGPCGELISYIPVVCIWEKNGSSSINRATLLPVLWIYVDIHMVFQGCAARNVHGFTQDDIQRMAGQWEEAPSMYLQLDIKVYLTKVWKFYFGQKNNL